MKIESLDRLIELFSSLPGIGEKSAERMVLALLNKEPDQIKQMAVELQKLSTIRRCKICNNLSETDNCLDCANDSKVDVLCVTDDIKNIILFNKHNIFNGRYFLLNGLISPIKGIDVDELNIEQLKLMVDKFKIKEIFLALKPSIEGETTSLYLANVLRNKAKITRMAQGIPMGTEIEYLDILTIEQAMLNRKEI